MSFLRSPWLWVAMLLALLSDFSFLSRKPLEYDELLVWHLARADWETLWSCDIEPAGFYLWARPLRALFGSPLSLRAFEAVMAALWVLPVWAIGSALGGRAMAAGSALYIALHPLRLRCGQYGRVDALSALFDLLALWALLSLLTRRGRKTGFMATLFFLLSTLTWLTYLPFSTSLLSRAAVLFVLASIRQVHWAAALASLSSLALLLGWSLFQLPHAPSLEKSLAGGMLVGLSEPPLGHLTAFFKSPLENFSLAFSLSLNLVALWGAARLFRSPSGVAVVASWVGPVFISSAMCGLGLMPPQPGYLSATLGPFSLCFLAGLLRLRWPTRAVVLPFLSFLPLGVALLLLRPVGTVDFRAPTKFILSHSREGDLVFCQPPGADLPMRHYLEGRVAVEPSVPTFCTRVGNFIGLPAKPLTAREWKKIRERAQRAKRLWLVEWLYSPSIRLEWPRWPERRGYSIKLRKAFFGHTQAVVVSLYVKRGRR